MLMAAEPGYELESFRQLPFPHKTLVMYVIYMTEMHPHNLPVAKAADLMHTTGLSKKRVLGD